MVAQLEAPVSSHPSFTERQNALTVTAELEPNPVDLWIVDFAAGEERTLHLEPPDTLILGTAAAIAHQKILHLRTPWIGAPEVQAHHIDQPPEKTVDNTLRRFYEQGLLAKGAKGRRFTAQPSDILAALTPDSERVIEIIGHQNVAHPQGRHLVDDHHTRVLQVLWPLKKESDNDDAPLDVKRLGELAGIKDSQRRDVLNELTEKGFLSRSSHGYHVVDTTWQWLGEQLWFKGKPIKVSVRLREAMPYLSLKNGYNNGKIGESTNNVFNFSAEKTSPIKIAYPLSAPEVDLLPDERREKDAAIIVTHKKSLAEDIGDKVFGLPRTDFDNTHQNPRLEALTQSTIHDAKVIAEHHNIIWDALPQRARIALRRLVLHEALGILERQTRTLRRSEKSPPTPVASRVFAGLEEVTSEMARLRGIDWEHTTSPITQLDYKQRVLVEFDKDLASQQQTLPDRELGKRQRGIQVIEVHPEPIHLTVKTSSEDVSAEPVVLTFKEKRILAIAAALTQVSLDKQRIPWIPREDIAKQLVNGFSSGEFISKHVLNPLTSAGLFVKSPGDLGYRLLVSPDAVLKMLRSDHREHELTGGTQDTESLQFKPHQISFIEELARIALNEPINVAGLGRTIGKSPTGTLRIAGELAEIGILKIDTNGKFVINEENKHFIDEVASHPSEVRILVSIGGPGVETPDQEPTFPQISWKETAADVTDNIEEDPAMLSFIDRIINAQITEQDLLDHSNVTVVGKAQLPTGSGATTLSIPQAKILAVLDFLGIGPLEMVTLMKMSPTPFNLNRALATAAESEDYKLKNIEVWAKLKAHSLIPKASGNERYHRTHLQESAVIFLAHQREKNVPQKPVPNESDGLFFDFEDDEWD